MPSLHQLPSRSNKPKENDGVSSSIGQNESALSTTNSPSKGSAESNPSKASLPRKNKKMLLTVNHMNMAASPPPSSKQRLPSALRTISPSPYQVLSDLIDATAHEIIHLEGNNPESIVPFKSYAVLAQRLDYYMDQLDPERGDSESQRGVKAARDFNEKRPIIKDIHVRCRLLMAKLAIDVCARSTYSEVYVDTSKSFEALIHLTASQWNEMRQKIEKLHHTLQSAGGPLFESLNCQMEAMESLALLRSRLGRSSPSVTSIRERGCEKSSLRLSSVGDHLEQYKTKSDAINSKLQTIDQTSHADLFVPHQILSLKRCSTFDMAEYSINLLIEGIDDMISKKVFPLRNIQARFLKLLKEWERTYLPPPTLFKAAYFSLKSSPSFDAASTSFPVSPSRQVYNSRVRAWRPAEMSPPNNYDDFDERASKRCKRIPYSEVEKKALLEGVERFGAGRWTDILNYYRNVFKVNNRTNVNLKDLYRTLTK